MKRGISNVSAGKEGDIPPGFTLRCWLKGHSDVVRCVRWSPNGKILASSSSDKTIRRWDVQTGTTLRILEGHSEPVHIIAWSPNGKLLASSSHDATIRLWDVQAGHTLRILNEDELDLAPSIAWSPDGEILASSRVDKTIRLWDVQNGTALRIFEGHSQSIHHVAWSPNGKLLASSSEDKTIRRWDVQTGTTLRILEGHSGPVYGINWLSDGEILASSSDDTTIRLWNVQTGRTLRVLEGHTSTPTNLSLSSDELFLASKSTDGTVRIWRTQTGNCVATLEEPTPGYSPRGLAFHPTAPVLATLGANLQGIRVWDLNVDILLKLSPVAASVYYTTAKIALVGDSGVGKSGLGYRIAEDRFLVTESTHGQQFWVVDKLRKKRSDGTECEAVLWDFAGQPNFRPIHALFLDDVDLALTLFDPSRQDTLTGVDYWLKQLAYKQQICRTVLVAARSDVSKLSLSSTELESFCRERNITGGFVVTSSKTGTGVDTLIKLIQQEIDWDAKPTTITTQTFKRVKDYVLSLKANAERKNVLVSPAQLRTQLEAIDPNWQFTDAEMMAAVGHLQNHGYVTIVHGSSEVQSILLAPDLLINLAASYLLRAQSNERGLGALEESRALRNEYHFQEVENLSQDERDALLNAVTEMFLGRNICFRESIDNQTFLIFPSLILERPMRLIEETELVEDTAYVVTGLVENIYPALVVLLGYSPSFQRTYQWRKQAQYETVRGQICGFKLANDDPAELELVLYYGKNTPDFVRSRFQGLFEEILYAREVFVKKYPPIFCPKCGRQQERRTVIRRIQEGQKFLFCEQDGKKMPLPKATDRIALSTHEREDVIRERALSKMRTNYETALVRMKGVIRDRAVATSTTCFVSYAWGVSEHERWVLRLSDDLRKADVDVILDQLDNPVIGSSVSRFISRIEECDFILVIGTPSYRHKYENKVSRYGSVVAAEVDLINVRLTGTEEQKASILPLLLAGEERTSFPPLLHRRVYGDFSQSEYYFVTLFDVVLTLHRIPFNDAIVRDLRAKLRKDAEALITQSKTKSIGFPLDLD